jgi:hypothetical protein
MAYIPPSIPVTNGYPTTSSNGNSTIDTVMKFLNSPAGAALIQAGGAGLQAYGQNKQADANRTQNANEFTAQFLNNQLNDDRNFKLNQAVGAANVSPIGESQLYAQRNGILNAILPSLRNFSATPGDPAVAAAMGSINGGLRLPEGGLDPSLIDRLFGDKSTLEAIKNRNLQVGQINPMNPVMDLSSLYGQAGTDASTDIRAANAQQMAADAEKEAQQRAIIMRALDNDISGQHQGPPPDGYEYDKKTGQLKKKGSGIWGKIGKAALIAGSIGLTAATAGAASPLIPLAVGAGTGALTGAMNGGGVKGALLGAGLGAATGGIGGGAASSAGKAFSAAAAKEALKDAYKNPALYSAILGGR